MSELLEWWKILSDWIQVSPVLIFFRNLLILLAIGYLAYRYIFSRQGGWLRESVPALGKIAVMRQARGMVKAGEYAHAGDLYLRYQMHKAAVQTFIDGQLFGRAADVYVGLRQKEKAAGLYERAGQFEKAAELYIEKKNFEKAQENLRKLGKEEEMANLYEKMGADTLAADIFLKNGQINKAVKLWAKLKEFKQAAEVLEKIFLDPNTIYGADIGYKNQEELVKACGELYQKADQVDKAAGILAKQGLYLEAGHAYVAGEKYEKAIECFSKGDHYAAAAEVYYKLGKHQQAASLEAEGFILKGEDEDAAKAYVKAGEYAKAGDVYRNMAEHLKAGEMYEKAREHSLAGSMFREAKQYERSAACFEKAKRYDEAIELYGLAENYARQVSLLEKSNRFHDAALNYYERGLLDDAKRILSKIPVDHEDFRKARSLEGKILLEEGQFSKAKQRLEEAMSDVKKIGESDVATILDLARATEGAGEQSQVLFTIEKMLAEEFIKSKSDEEDPLREVKRKLSKIVSGATTASTVMPKPAFADTATISLGAAAPAATVAHEKPRYVPIKEIGKGGMGVVYKARDTVLDRVVALKVLPASLKTNKQAVATFTREGKSAASLNHKNIVTVHDAGMQAGEYYIAMELIDGMTIKEIIKKKSSLVIA